MSCPETQTTLLWLYGEADESHGEHVASCADCQAVITEQEEVVSALGPALSALGASPPSALVAPPPQPTPANRPGRSWQVVALVALAAAAAVVIGVASWQTDTTPEIPPVASHAPAPLGRTVDTAVAQTAVVLPSVDALDLRLDALELELDALSLDLETL